MNGSASPKDQVLSIENVEFVTNDSNKRRSSKKKKRSKSGSDDVLLGAPMQDETNPLLGTSPSGGGGGYGMPQQYGQPYYPAALPDYYGGGSYDYSGYQGQQHPPSPPQAYPPPAMMGMPPNAMYPQYYDQMGAPMYPGQQQVPSPQQHSPYNDASGQRRMRSPPSAAGQQKQQRQHGRRSAQSPPSEQIRKPYPDVVVPDGGGGVDLHPLKRASQVQGGSEEFEIPLRGGSAQKLAYGAIPDSTTPPRSSRSKASKPPRRKSDTLAQRPPSPLMRSHRRVSSDDKFGRHRRTNSDKGYPVDSEPAKDGKHRRSSSDRLPPAGLGRIRKKLNPFPSNRRRSYSGGAGSTVVKRPSHARASSLSEVSLGASVATSTSMVSHVTDISKSAFFGGTTESGKVQLHFPFENVRLTMDDALPTGVLYMRHVEEEQYEDYHILNDEHSIPWELDGELPCMCTCDKCVGCTERNQQLAPNHYIMTVEDDLYRRIFDEISASRTIPCGLFYCGHHEDVSHPSILIAGIVVFLVFVGLAVATIMTSA